MVFSEQNTRCAVDTEHNECSIDLGALTIRICFADLPLDILFLILDQFLPTWALVDHPDGPSWTVGRLQDPLDITVASHNFRALALTSRRMREVATPYLYRILHLRDIDTVLSVWSTLSRHRPAAAPHVRHLLFGLSLDDWASVRPIEAVLLPLCAPTPAPARHKRRALDPFQIDPERIYQALQQQQRHRQQQQQGAMRWASGEVMTSRQLYAFQPPVVHRLVFDIVQRCVNVQGLAIMPPAQGEASAVMFFKQALGSVAGPRFLGPTAVILQGLRVLTLQIKNSCRQHLSVYGVLTLPRLKRLTLVSDEDFWIMRLHDSPELVEAKILSKIRSLSIFWGHRAPLFNSDLKLGLGGLPRLENLSIYLHPSFTKGLSRVAPTAFADLNLQLAGHARGLRTLDVGWVLEADSAAWAYLGPARRLCCLPALRNLVRLQVSTQALFGGTLPLFKRLIADHAGGAAGGDPEVTNASLRRVLARTLPPALRHLVLLERWSAYDMGHESAYGGDRIEFDATHEQGDWMEVRWRDGGGGGGGGGEEKEEEEEADAAKMDMINTPADYALLALMRVLCEVWLGGRREERVVELQPRDGYFYGAYVHRVLMATRGLEELRVQRGMGPRGVGCWAYCFVDTEFMRGVEVDVGRKK